MDWIADVLRRQQAAWNALLSAASPAERKTSESPRDDPAFHPGEGAASRTPTLRLTEAVADARAFQGRAALSRADGRREAAETVEPMEPEIRALMRRDGGSSPVYAFPAGTAEEDGEEMLFSAASFREPQRQALELSKTVERDARRYDGGFSPF